ncbi:hypothetical protein STEG23_020508, partial [Scotinomys teguina]
DFRRKCAPEEAGIALFPTSNGMCIEGSQEQSADCEIYIPQYFKDTVMLTLAYVAIIEPNVRVTRKKKFKRL